MRKNVSNKAFFIGNGFNQAFTQTGKSWTDLLKHLSDSFSVKVDLTNEFKPFPLSFEEILFKTKGDFDENYKNIKNNIADVFKDTDYNELHRLIVKSGVEHIITTNYDYAFEKVIASGFNNNPGDLPVSTKEIKNSIKRRSFFEEDKLSIWHIHGEINDNKVFTKEKNYPSKSILIGYEQYLNYLGEIQKYINGNKSENKKSIITRLKSQDFIVLSWIDLFFTHDIVIIGFSFDFSEHHLWWLLNYRAKQIKRNKIKCSNTIKFYYEKFPEYDIIDAAESEKNKVKLKLTKAKLDLFNSLYVEAMPIECEDYDDYYNKILDKKII